MKKFTAVLRYLISIHLLGMLFFTIFRIILYLLNSEMVAGVENKGWFFMRAMLKGVQFDSLVVSYITFLPLLILSIFVLFNKISRKAIIVINIYFIVLYTLAFSIYSSDIPYFSYFFTHLGVAAFEWFEFGGTTLGMLFQPEYYFYFALWAVSTGLFVFIVLRVSKRLLNKQYSNLKRTDYKYYIPLTVLLWGVCFLGMRGSLQRYPLQIGYAYFSNNSFFNQLGINPCFSLLKNLNSTKKYNNVNDQMTIDSAFLLVNKALNIEPSQNHFAISRDIFPQGELQKPNIVIVLLESMAAKYLDYECLDGKLTPFMHELISKSYYFENCYSSGIHTNNGIVSTLYGFPTLFDKHSMKNEVRYTGLPVNLRNHGYQNLFFIAGNPHFDHMNFFLMGGGFDHIYSQEDYPQDKVVNVFGAQDDMLFECSFDKINKAALEGKPFLSVLLTVSNHPPYIVPEKYMNVADTDDKKMTRFVDDVLKKFIKDASKQDWFENTIFVFTSDHGKILEQPKYDMPIDYNHIPLIIYSPMFKDAPKRFDGFCGQIDIFPTLMGILNMPYTNHSLGIDLLKDRRPYIYFVDDNRLGCINEDYFYIRNITTSTDKLYNLNDSTYSNIIQKEPQIVQSMKSYAISMMIVAEYLIKSNKASK